MWKSTRNPKLDPHRTLGPFFPFFPLFLATNIYYFSNCTNYRDFLRKNNNILQTTARFILNLITNYFAIKKIRIITK